VELKFISLTNSNGLFKYAAVESPHFFTTYPTKARAQANALNIATQLGCQNNTSLFSCMQSANASAIVSANFANTTIPNQDNIELSGLPYNLLMAGKINSGVQSIIIGTTSNEGSLFISPTLSSTQAKCNTNYPFCQWNYPCSNYSNCYSAMVDCYTDFYVCSTDGIIKSTALTNSLNVYVYEFTSTPSFYTPQALGPTHTSEISFVWRYPYFSAPASFTANETLLSNDLNNYWIGLATTGNPNSKFVTSTWNKVNGTTLNIIQFQSNGVTPYNVLPDFISYVNLGASKTQQCMQWNAQANTNTYYSPGASSNSSSSSSANYISCGLLLILALFLNI